MNVEKRDCVQVCLTCAEGSSILVLAQNGSLPTTAHGASVVDRVREALMQTGFEDGVGINLECTEDEARFLEHCRLA